MISNARKAPLYQCKAFRLFAILILVCMLFLNTSVTAYAEGGTPPSSNATQQAGTDIFTWAKAAITNVYGQIVAISTTVACCMCAVAMLVINFSMSGKAVDEARSWFKRILVCWIVINVLGFIMAYLQPLVENGSQII